MALLQFNETYMTNGTKEPTVPEHQVSMWLENDKTRHVVSAYTVTRTVWTGQPLYEARWSDNAKQLVVRDRTTCKQENNVKPPAATSHLNAIEEDILGPRTPPATAKITAKTPPRWSFTRGATVVIAGLCHIGV